jgi:hypothetical protein
MWILKLTFLYTSEAKKLERKHDEAPHDHKHIGTYHFAEKSHWSKLQTIRVQNSMGKHGLSCVLLESS